ncbi:hypothetical protein [Jeotgalibacillus malaysiensis]|uniref:hypothetical protein n=1 Tax=Jeotgalibacillus malaysiensis TaxID=1508404 RepID=UPI00384DD89A
MTKYLWELDLQSVPLGFESDYNEFKKTDLGGAIYHDEDGEVYRYNPVKFAERTLSLFNSEKLKAVELHKQLKSNFTKEYYHQLIHIDVRLFGLLDVWTGLDGDISSYDPNNVIANAEAQMKTYFSDYNPAWTNEQNHLYQPLKYFQAESFFGWILREK